MEDLTDKQKQIIFSVGSALEKRHKDLADLLTHVFSNGQDCFATCPKMMFVYKNSFIPRGAYVIEKEIIRKENFLPFKLDSEIKTLETFVNETLHSKENFVVRSFSLKTEVYKKPYVEAKFSFKNINYIATMDASYFVKALSFVGDDFKLCQASVKKININIFKSKDKNKIVFLASKVV